MMAAPSTSLTIALLDNPHAFLQPSLPLYTDTLALLKHTLDPLAADVHTAQQQRDQAARRKRKRGLAREGDVLQIKQVRTGGLAVEQVWEQARRVIDAARAEAERGLLDAEARGEGSATLANGAKLMDELDGSEEDASSMGDEGVDYEVEGPDVDDEDEGDGDDEAFEDFSGNDDYDEDIEMEGSDDEDEISGNDEPPQEFVADKFGLNDGFFSIDDFNRQSDFLEQQDARGEDDGVASDEEDVDWDADPLSQPVAGEEVPDESEEDEEGPTFGDPDAPSEDGDEAELDDGEMDLMGGGMANTNHIMYADFFAPPAQKKKKKKNGRLDTHNVPAKAVAQPADIQDEDMERTMAAVHRDLFDDEESEPDNENDDSLDPGNLQSRRSTHERRRAALAAEIRTLEAANVAKRSWTLSGEARAADRPVNSLLEEALDFERAGKPVPVITAEVSESIEELIKRRILAHDFQDLIRRRPNDLATGGTQRGRLDIPLDDNKSKKGLADEYEEDLLRATDPNHVSATSAQQQKEEKEIEALWRKINIDLDGLSSWHFRPKKPAPQLDIRVDAPAIAMEDARPTAGGEVAGASRLAPQEVYRAGEKGATAAGEVVGKSGVPAARTEMGQEEKKRRRRREKERWRKAGVEDAGKRGGKDDAVVGELKKGGVRVIGKKGMVTDVEGKGIRGDAQGGQRGGGRYKL